MFRIAKRLDPGSREVKLYAVPETVDEENFVKWFHFIKGIPTRILAKKECFEFMSDNDEYYLQKSINKAFRRYRDKFVIRD
ncbi:MAG: hypothetical protein HYU64_19130 [Armatimonadetes bacterium]|nr:hypothetical protein [Armatimonadota bacterium]